MDTGQTVDGLNKLKGNVCAVENPSLIILAMPEEESIVPMNARISNTLRKRQGYALIAAFPLTSTLPCIVFAVRGSAALQERKLLTGRLRREFSNSAFSVEKSFGENFLILKLVEESSVLANVRLSHSALTIPYRQVFMVQGSGYRQEKEFSNEMGMLAKFVILKVRAFLFTIKNLGAMVESRTIRTLLRFAQDAT